MPGITAALVAITTLPLLAMLGVVTGTAIVGAHAAASCSDQSAALGGTAPQPDASATATNGIPASYLALYKNAGQNYYRSLEREAANLQGLLLEHNPQAAARHLRSVNRP